MGEKPNAQIRLKKIEQLLDDVSRRTNDNSHRLLAIDRQIESMGIHILDMKFMVGLWKFLIEDPDVMEKVRAYYAKVKEGH